jgi:WD40 repeat protein
MKIFSTHITGSFTRYQLLKTLVPPFASRKILSLAWNSDESRLATIYVTDTDIPNVIVWDVILSSIVGTQDSGFARFVDWSPINPDQLMITLGSVIAIWNIADELDIAYYDPLWTELEYAQWSPSGTQVALIGDIGNVRIIDIQTQATVFEQYENLPLPERNHVYFSLSFSPVGDRIALYNISQIKNEIWNIATGQLENEFDSFDTSIQRNEVVRWSNKGIVGIDYQFNKIVLYNPTNGVFEYLVNGQDFLRVVVSADGNDLLLFPPQLIPNTPFFSEIPLPLLPDGTLTPTATVTSTPLPTATPYCPSYHHCNQF